MGEVDADGTMSGGELLLTRLPLPLDDVPVHAMKQLMRLNLVGGSEPPDVTVGLSSSTLPVRADGPCAVGGRSEAP